MLLIFASSAIVCFIWNYGVILCKYSDEKLGKYRSFVWFIAQLDYILFVLYNAVLVGKLNYFCSLVVIILDLETEVLLEVTPCWLLRTMFSKDCIALVFRLTGPRFRIVGL